VVRTSLRNTTVQFIEYELVGDRVLASATSKELKKFGWDGSTSNLTAAYLTGLLAGTRALEKKVENAVFDIGIKVPAKGAKIFATLKGIVDAGVDIPHGDEILPDEYRIKGSHINDKIPQQFDAVKSKIMAGDKGQSQLSKASTE
jgi:large subunit ribosomal protein L18